MTRTESKDRLKRRNFLKWGGAGLAALPLAMNTRPAAGSTSSLCHGRYWFGPEGEEYCVHRTVDAGETYSDYLWAKVDGRWDTYALRETEDGFWSWSFEARREMFQRRIDGDWEPWAGGAHGPSLATFGNAAGRGDSRFHIDNTIVDLTVAPKQQNVRDLNQELMGLISGNADVKEKLQFLIDINEQDLWRRDMQIGTAHFNTPQFATHQFLNIMENPVGTLCYQGSRGMDVFRSYELRCIVNIVHPKNPHLSEGTRELAMYPSILYGLYHGLPEDGPNIPAALYCMNEEYDNSPGERPGLRVVPPLEE